MDLHYDPTCKKDVEQVKYLGTGQQLEIRVVPVPGASGAPEYTRMGRLAITAERLLCILEDKLVPLLVLEAQLRVLRDIYGAPDPKHVNKEASSQIWDSCVKQAVQTIKKPCD
ncbi:MAG: hypothetical protein H0W34_04490 [Pyrinomonadaceae bacterium]|nr:hypothetical protein [Pyrinomonadaceae bacterium]